MSGQMGSQPQDQGQQQSNQNQAGQANSLVEALSASGVTLPDDQLGAVEKALLANGWRPKQQIDRIAQTAYQNGQQNAEAAIKKQTQQRQEPVKEVVAESPVLVQPNAGIDPQVAAVLSEVAKWQKNTNQQLAESKAEIARLHSERAEREVSGRILKEIADQGLEAPESVLHLLRRQCDFVPDPSDPSELVAVKQGRDPHDIMPVDGPGTFTTAKEFIQRWANSPDGLRYKKVPEGARQGAGISGGGGGNAPTGKGPLHPDLMRAAMKDLGFI